MNSISINSLINVLKKKTLSGNYSEGFLSSSLPNLPDHTVNDWQLIPDIYYLLDTVKVRFESEFGKITLENININNIRSCLSHVKNTAFPNSDKHDSPVMVTVCGVTWEYTSSGQRRIRAIPKVAGIRYFYEDQRDSDAYFYHADKVKLDCSPSDYFSERLCSEVSVSSHLTVAMFLRRLEENNRQFLLQHGEKLYLRKENFKAPLSRHERESVTRVMNTIEL